MPMVHVAARPMVISSPTANAEPRVAFGSMHDEPTDVAAPALRRPRRPLDLFELAGQRRRCGDGRIVGATARACGPTT